MAALMELVVDFYGYPEIQPRVSKCNRHQVESAFYDKVNNELYLGDEDGFLRNGEDSDPDVEITMELPELPAEDLANLGEDGSMVLRADTQGEDLVITPKQDGVAQTVLTAVTSSSLEFMAVSLPLNVYYTLGATLRITSTGTVRIMDPIFLRENEGASGG